MPIIRINATGDTLTLHNSPQSPFSLLCQTRHIQGPVILMSHGYRFRPGLATACPHQHFLSLPRTSSPTSFCSWPRQLGFGTGLQTEGLGIAFGWNARGSFWGALRRAHEAGRVLAELIRELHHLNPRRPIHFIGHSVGTELALEALHHIRPGSLNRIISLTGAAYQSRALRALATPAGRRAEFINITSRENDLFDFLYECLIPPPEQGDRSIGSGLTAPNAITLQLDCPDTLNHLAHHAFAIHASRRRFSHWSSYTRPGALQVYQALLRSPNALSLADLRSGIPPLPQRRWSRLFAWAEPLAFNSLSSKTS